MPGVFAQLLLFSPRTGKLSNVGRDRYLSKSLLCPLPLFCCFQLLGQECSSQSGPPRLGRTWDNLVGAEHLKHGMVLPGNLPSPPCRRDWAAAIATLLMFRFFSLSVVKLLNWLLRLVS